MSQDRVTEVTRQSWFSRLGSAGKGVAIGILLFALAFPLLFWNEGRAVKQHKALDEGAGAVIPVSSDMVDSANEDHLVHMTGTVTTDAQLTDADFGISVTALKLRRMVEMYQWQETASTETKDKIGGAQETVTTYTYDKGWSDRAIDSGGFKEPTGHQNPNSMPYGAAEYEADPVTLGAFTLSESLVDKVDSYEPLPLDDGAIPSALKGKASVQGDTIYIGANPAVPQVGDVRVTFASVPPTVVSVVARQAGASLSAYETGNGQRLELLVQGERTAGEMFEAAEEGNRVLTWVLRVAGFLVMMIGLNVALKPFSVLADVFPVVGSIVEKGTGIIAGLISAALSLVTIGIAWIVYRPLVAVILLAVVAAIVVGIVLLVRSGKATAPAASAGA